MLKDLATTVQIDNKYAVLWEKTIETHKTEASDIADVDNRLFIWGTGIGQPRGLLYSPNPTKKYWPEPLEKHLTRPLLLERLARLTSLLRPEYLPNAKFLMNALTHRKITQIARDETSLKPAIEIFGHEVVIDNDMPDMECGQFALAFGDFNAGYAIVFRTECKIIRGKRILTKYIGGDVIDNDAIKLLRF